MARKANATVPRSWYTFVRNRPTPGTPMAKSASLCSANSFTCRGVMICSASDLSSSGFNALASSGTSSPFTRIVAGRPTLSSRSEAFRWTIWVMACLKLNVPAALWASGMGIHSEKGLAELDRLRVLHQHLADHAGHFRLDLIHDLHRFDDAHHLARGNAVAHLGVRLRAGLGRGVEGPHHRGLDLDQMGRGGGGGGSGPGAGAGRGPQPAPAPARGPPPARQRAGPAPAPPRAPPRARPPLHLVHQP